MIPTLAQAVQAMTKLLTEENKALGEMDFSRAGALLAPKHAAADALAAAWRAATQTDAPQADLMKLGELAEENRRLLNRAMRVQRRVLDLVAKAARSSHAPTRYGAGGRAAGANGSPRSLITRI
jgi:hypothetical protein